MKYCKSFLMVLGILGIILNACGQTKNDSRAGLFTVEDLNPEFFFKDEVISEMWR
ncbi:hypothetical protein [Pontibacillus salipaludis]|uniref:hypothetical protein n=1 Tax=Pontibacillus salipaludis TaxID=1697394 RepID=UPI0031E9BDC3